MKFYFFFIGLFCCLLLTAQKSKKDALSSFDLFYGTRFYQNNFYDQLNTFQKHKIGFPVQLIGIGTSSFFLIGRESSYYGHINYHQVIPQNISVEDSLSCKVAGFMFSFAFGTALTTHSGNFIMYMYIGLNTGRLILFDNAIIQQKNAFFSPKVGIQPKVKVGKIAISLVAEYDYDISKVTWRRTIRAAEPQSGIIDLRQTAFSLQLGVGYIL